MLRQVGNGKRYFARLIWWQSSSWHTYRWHTCVWQVLFVLWISVKLASLRASRLCNCNNIMKRVVIFEGNAVEWTKVLVTKWLSSFKYHYPMFKWRQSQWKVEQDNLAPFIGQLFGLWKHHASSGRCWNWQWSFTVQRTEFECSYALYSGTNSLPVS